MPGVNELIEKLPPDMREKLETLLAKNSPELGKTLSKLMEEDIETQTQVAVGIILGDLHKLEDKDIRTDVILAAISAVATAARVVLVERMMKKPPPMIVEAGLTNKWELTFIYGFQKSMNELKDKLLHLKNLSLLVPDEETKAS